MSDPGDTQPIVDFEARDLPRLREALPQADRLSDRALVGLYREFSESIYFAGWMDISSLTRFVEWATEERDT